MVGYSQTIHKNDFNQVLSVLSKNIKNSQQKTVKEIMKEKQKKNPGIKPLNFITI